MPTNEEITQIINALEGTKHLLAAEKVRHKELGLDWARTQDSRSGWFDGTWKVLTLTQAHLQLFRGYVQHLGWWNQFTQNMTAELLEALKSEADSPYRFSVLHTNYSQLEEHLRRITAVFDPAFMSKPQTIAASHGHLMKELGLQHYTNLFWLSRLVRNSIHNNGYFRPDRGGDQDLLWAETTYEFRVDRPILWLSWHFIAAHITDLCEAMAQIVTHERIVALPTITRPD